MATTETRSPYCRKGLRRIKGMRYRLNGVFLVDLLQEYISPEGFHNLSATVILHKDRRKAPGNAAAANRKGWKFMKGE